ncbi:thioesterase domain-containing protein [Streptomyces olivoreticuli]|uniref:Alpha/beta fold hydrolase n=1 Tax=Streptomyces blastmyceticus TaxID=68180 RepID=A0A1L7P0D7_9ACTN|nr:thioesterase domain-containing protein [Streptomyces olivoreticuli]WKK25371.1 thioesterase domain-containing protein [Streptomyces olivoreticuli]BAW35631.1 putative type II TE [Streptomyces blastmyceticus]
MSQIESDEVHLIRIVQPETPSSFRLICFPESALSSAYYLSLSELLLPTVEVLAIQYPLDADDEERLADSPDLADRIFEALREWIDRPVALFGHGPGADLAYRVAERLERETETRLLTLFVSGRTARGGMSLGPPALDCRIVALAGEQDPMTPLRGVRAWRRRTSGRFDLEVFPGSRGYLDSSRREVVNLVHDQLLSLSTLDVECEIGAEDKGV